MAARLASAAIDDLAEIYRSHFSDLRELGESPAAATDAARRRVQGLAAMATALDNTAGRGTARDDILPGLSVLTMARAELWYSTGGTEITVLAILPEAPRPRRRMLARMLGASP